ncbi:MAG: 30S ribosomal protein S2 [Anaerolineales bacterium]
MLDISMKSLLETGVHFGHRTRKWNPRMKPFIFTERNNIHIIDLQQTIQQIEYCYNLIRDTVADGGEVLFVGTKRQAQDTIQTETMRCAMPSVTNRWLGGLLTNWRTMKERIKELERLERERDTGEWDGLTKKERLMLQRKIDKLEDRFGGIRNMSDLPALLFVVDVRREETAVREANILDIPIIAMVDTNCDPTPIDYVIPANDDAIRAIKLIVSNMANAVLEGIAHRKDEELEDEALTDTGAVPEFAGDADEELLGAATLAKLSSGELNFGDEAVVDTDKKEGAEEAKAEGEAPAAGDETPATEEAEASQDEAQAEPAAEVVES